MCIDAAIAVASYSSANHRLPIEIGIATGHNTLNIVIRRVPGQIELHEEHEEAVGLSSIEMDAVGLTAEKACDLINEFLVGGIVGCRDSREKEALDCLFQLAKQEKEFQLHELGSFNIIAPPCEEKSCVEMEARMLVFLAKQHRSRSQTCFVATA